MSKLAVTYYGKRSVPGEQLHPAIALNLTMGAVAGAVSEVDALLPGKLSLVSVHLLDVYNTHCRLHAYVQAVLGL